LEHSYAGLPPHFFSDVRPTPVASPSLVVLNRPLARGLGLDPDWLAENPAALAGNAVPPGARPVAQAYAGHQYAHFTNLGDGRAILLGEQITPAGERFDIQLKGAGRTPYSRRGDGRAALGPMLREFLVSEAMWALGIPTTRSLAVVATGEPVFREETLPGAVLVRVAASHIRVGTFEWAAACGRPESVRGLADYTIRRHYPELADTPDRYPAFFRAVLDRQARLIARWQSVGFVHGVMNTDNMAVSGETIDYGPCAFLDAYLPETSFSSIDRHGRYSYANQPAIAQWNLARFAEALVPLFDPDQQKAVALANEILSEFPAAFETARLARFRAKLGLATAEPGDGELVSGLLDWMRAARADFINTFHALAAPAAAAPDDPAFREWRSRWIARLDREPGGETAARSRMAAHNPVVIPRNHLVESALAAASEDGDPAPFLRLLEAVSDPFNPRHADGPFAAPPPPEAPPHVTFCGT